GEFGLDKGLLLRPAAERAQRSELPCERSALVVVLLQLDEKRPRMRALDLVQHAWTEAGMRLDVPEKLGDVRSVGANRVVRRVLGQPEELQESFEYVVEGGTESRLDRSSGADASRQIVEVEVERRILLLLRHTRSLNHSVRRICHRFRQDSRSDARSDPR